MGAKPKQFCVNGHDTNVVGRGARSSCRECQRLFYHSPSVRQRHLVGTRNKNWQRYGVKNEKGEQFTHLDFDRLYQIQGGKCALCSVHSTDCKRQLTADHDHETGRVRSLLCAICNQTIVGSNTIESALRVVEYLRAHASL